MSTVRLAVTQMDFFPANISSSVNYLQEPSGEDNGFHRLNEIPEIKKYCTESEKKYIQIINYKVQSILMNAIKKNIDIIIFPEYSIPVFLLSNTK